MIQEKIEIAKSAAKQIAQIEGISSAYVDDYNKFGSFQVVVCLDLNERKKPKTKNFNLRKISIEIKKIIKDTKEISTFGMGIDSPKRMYDKFTYRGKTDSTFIGYEKSYIMVDFIVT